MGVVLMRYVAEAQCVVKCRLQTPSVRLCFAGSLWVFYLEALDIQDKMTPLGTWINKRQRISSKTTDQRGKQRDGYSVWIPHKESQEWCERARDISLREHTVRQNMYKHAIGDCDDIKNWFYNVKTLEATKNLTTTLPKNTEQTIAPSRVTSLMIGLFRLPIVQCFRAVIIPRIIWTPMTTPLKCTVESRYPETRARSQRLTLWGVLCVVFAVWDTWSHKKTRSGWF